MTRKSYTVTMVNGSEIKILADIVTYDQIGNLVLMNQKKTLATMENPDGLAFEIVRCFNQRHYSDYRPSETIQ